MAGKGKETAEICQKNTSEALILSPGERDTGNNTLYFRRFLGFYIDSFRSPVPQLSLPLGKNKFLIG
jgi:hypothetical protein